MQFIGVLRSGRKILTDDYDEEEIRKGIPFKNIVKDLVEWNVKEPCMIYDNLGRFYKTVTMNSYTPLELYGV